MKSLYVAIAVAAALFGGAIGYSIYIKNVSESLNEYTTVISEQIQEENFPGAIKTAQELGKKIEDEKTMLGIMVDHKEVFEIKRSLGEMVRYLENEEANDSLAHCTAISVMTEKLLDNSILSIYNIL